MPGHRNAAPWTSKTVDKWIKCSIVLVQWLKLFLFKVCDSDCCLFFKKLHSIHSATIKNIYHRFDKNEFVSCFKPVFNSEFFLLASVNVCMKFYSWFLLWNINPRLSCLTQQVFKARLGQPLLLACVWKSFQSVPRFKLAMICARYDIHWPPCSHGSSVRKASWIKVPQRGPTELMWVRFQVAA